LKGPGPRLRPRRSLPVVEGATGGIPVHHRAVGALIEDPLQHLAADVLETVVSAGGEHRPEALRLARLVELEERQQSLSRSSGGQGLDPGHRGLHP